MSRSGIIVIYSRQAPDNEYSNFVFVLIIACEGGIAPLQSPRKVVYFVNERSRPVQVKVYLSYPELDTLNLLLKDFNGTKAEFIRSSILNANTTNLDAFRGGLTELIRQHKAIGNNINQLTRAVNQGKCQIDLLELQAIREELNNIWRLLKSLKAGEI